MTCKHETWTLQELARYDDSSPPNLNPRRAKICDECKEDLGELPTGVNFQFNGKGTNDRRFLRGETSKPD